MFRYRFAAMACTLMGALGLASCITPSSPYAATDQFLVDVAIIDIEQGDVSAAQTLVIRNGRILATGPVDTISLPADVTPLAMDGYVVPGLWDMHVHALSDPDTAVAYDFPLFLANGVIGIRDMGSVIDGIIETRARLAAQPELLAPHLHVSGPLLDGRALPWYGDLPLVLETPDAARIELPKLQAADMDFLKIYDGLSPETYAEIVAFAEAQGLPIAGHAPHGVGLKGAAEAGQRTIEHLSPFGLRDCLVAPGTWFQRAINAKFRDGYDAYYALTLDAADALDMAICAEVFAAMAENQTYFTPTLVMELNDRSRVPEADLTYLRPESLDWCQTGLNGIAAADPDLRERAYARYSDLLVAVRAQGVTLLAGSDTPNNCLMPGFSLHWELERLVEAGLAPIEALQSATLHAAAAVGRDHEIGKIAPGYLAELIVLDANPLDDIGHLRQIQGVLVQGSWIDSAQRTAMLDAVRAELDAPVATP